MRLIFVCSLWLLGLPVCLSIAGGAAQTFRDAPWERWQAGLHRDHPLAGRIWSRKARAFVGRAQLLGALARSGYTLLGEVHDNPDHHRLQAWLIAQAVRAGRRPAIVMEQIARSQTAALAAYQARPDADAAGLGKALDWEKSGWPKWSLYEPIARAAFEAGLVIHAGDVDRTLLRKVRQQGPDALPKDQRALFGLDRPLAPALRNGLLDELVASHCNMGTREMMMPFLAAQRLRDAVLADSLLRAGGAKGDAVLIAGNGHIRQDRGVPWYLRHRKARGKVLTIMLVEVSPDLRTITDLPAPAADGLPPADFVWLTPAQSRPDPCIRFRKKFRVR